MKDSEILKGVRDLISNKYETYICFGLENVRFALRSTERSSGKNDAQIANLRRWIHKMLNGAVSYEHWLGEYHPELIKSWDPRDNRQGRIQWLDWMIKQCEKEERK